MVELLIIEFLFIVGVTLFAGRVIPMTETKRGRRPQLGWPFMVAVVLFLILVKPMNRAYYGSVVIPARPGIFLLVAGGVAFAGVGAAWLFTLAVRRTGAYERLARRSPDEAEETGGRGNGEVNPPRDLASEKEVID